MTSVLFIVKEVNMEMLTFFPVHVSLPAVIATMDKRSFQIFHAQLALSVLRNMNNGHLL